MKKEKLEKENERLKGDLELWESGACRATNIDKCGVVKELEAKIDKMKNALNKIIKTVQNDNISAYGERLVVIYDISCEVLQEIKEK
jgi:hypothetical protein